MNTLCFHYDQHLPRTHSVDNSSRINGTDENTWMPIVAITLTRSSPHLENSLRKSVLLGSAEVCVLHLPFYFYWNIGVSIPVLSTISHLLHKSWPLSGQTGQTKQSCRMVVRTSTQTGKQFLQYLDSELFIKVSPSRMQSAPHHFQSWKDSEERCLSNQHFNMQDQYLG